MRFKTAWLYLLVVTLSAAVLYGATYQQFRFFRLNDPGGAADAISYVEMSNGNFDVGFHRYRWMTPTAARLVRLTLGNAIPDEALAVKLSFYIVNFVFSLGTCVVLFALLQAIGFSVPLALLGICAFASSRITVIVTATPLVDAAYFFSVTTLLYLIVARKRVILAVSLPIMVICKETILPFLFLPLLTDIRRSRAYVIGLAVALVTFVVSRYIIDITNPSFGQSFAQTVFDHFDGVRDNLEYLFTLKGIHDLQNGFSFFLVFAAFGGYLNMRHRYYFIPRVVLATVPIGIGYIALSDNLGRQFFIAFPAIIAFALVFINYVSVSCATTQVDNLESSKKD